MNSNSLIPIPYFATRNNVNMYPTWPPKILGVKLKYIVETVKTLSLILFQALFTTFSGYFSAFPHGTFALSVYLSIFSLGRNLSPTFGLYYQTILLMDSNFFTNF